MRNSAKKVVKAVVLGVMLTVIGLPILTKPVDARDEMIRSTVKTTIRYKVMPNGGQFIHLMGDHDDVIEEVEKIKDILESGTLKSMFLISSLNDTRNTEVHLFVENKDGHAFLERLQYEGSPERVKAKEEELKENGYVIEGYVEYSGDLVDAWAKLIAIKISTT